MLYEPLHCCAALATFTCAQFVTAPANETLAAMEADGRVFDFVTLDADKPMHDEYYNASLRLLWPGGLLIMFGIP